MAYNGLECIIIVLLYCRGYTVQYNNDLEFIIIVLQGDIQFSITMAYNGLECIIIVLLLYCRGIYSSVYLWPTMILNVLLLYYCIVGGYTVQYNYGLQWS